MASWKKFIIIWAK